MYSLPRTPAERFASIIALLCRTVAASIAGGRLAGPLIILIWRRLNRMGIRFAAIAARHDAGTLRPPRRRPQAPRPPLARPRKPDPLPRGKAWLLRLVPEAAGGASQLQHLLADAEMAALIAAAPQAGRILRPLCRMLGIPLPAALAPPPPPDGPIAPCRAASGRPSPAASPPPARPAPAPAVAPPPSACGPPVVAA